MRAAPPVDAALADGRFERMLITLLHAGVGGLLAAWLGLHAVWPAQALLLASLLAAIAMAVLGAQLACRALSPLPGQLRWDGRRWHSVSPQGDRPLARLVVALDLGTWVLLKLHPAGGRGFWRVASAAGAQAAWHGLRVALAAHAGAAQPATDKAAP
jgi:hypothetical protein